MKKPGCPIADRCGGCSFSDLPYKEELQMKMEYVDRQLGDFGPIAPILGMKDPTHYRGKVQAVFGFDRNQQIVSGLYRKGTHFLTPVRSCELEFSEAEKILQSIRHLMKSYHMEPYNEDYLTGDLRHVLLRKGHNSGQILVVLIFGHPYFSKRKEFANSLKQLHPEITSVVYQVNGEKTSMVLSDGRIERLVGPGYIEDTLCGLSFRISPASFYQINSEQTEVLYGVAMRMARLTGKERVLDAYCGTGTIGLVAAKNAGFVLGVELNHEAVADAITNAKANKIENADFVEAEASEYLKDVLVKEEKAHFDVAFIDPPRQGSDERFLASLIRLAPESIIYISCNPQTQARDLDYLMRFSDYRVVGIQPIDMFPRTEHVECVCLMSRVDK